jgi:UDP-N-acetylglucosamine 2-epimerase (non-hydrolysing)
MEAGNRCFDERVPEETNRRIVDHIADINLTYSDISREYLLREGLLPDRIIKTGSPMLEVLTAHREMIEASNILERLGLKSKQYFVVSAHREENINSEKSFLSLVESLNSIAEQYQLPMVFSTHPRTKKMMEEKSVSFHPLINNMKPLGFSDYNKLQIEARAVLSDSGTISEEASILGLRALNIREAHERPEAMEEATVMLVGLGKERILQGLSVLEKVNRSRPRLVNDYNTPNVSEKIVGIIVSYVNYINGNVWKIS